MQNSGINKKKIIAAIEEIEDDRILFAISRLLELKEQDIPEWHKEILQERLTEIEAGTAVFENLDDLKATLFSKK